MAIRYRCPDSACRKTFPWDSADDPPNLCPHCGYCYAERDDTVVYMPNILSDKTKSIEKVARDVMDGSEVRAQLAAEAAGCRGCVPVPRRHVGSAMCRCRLR